MSSTFALIITIPSCPLTSTSIIQSKPVADAESYSLRSISGSPRIRKEGRNIKYVGELTPEGLSQLQTLTKNESISSLTIASGGGEVSVSIDFGVWVFENGLDVIVEKACLSSCANYIFPAGNKKTILPGGLVAWHGSIMQRDFQSESQLRAKLKSAHKAAGKEVTYKELDEAVKVTAALLTELKEKQKTFYERIGVDEYVTRIGNEMYKARGFYFISVADMEKFGIKNISAPADYVHVDLTELNRLIAVPIQCVKLGTTGLTTC